MDLETRERLAWQATTRSPPLPACLQEARRGRNSRFMTNVTLSLRDASNQPAAITITDIVLNKASGGFKCERRPA